MRVWQVEVKFSAFHSIPCKGKKFTVKVQTFEIFDELFECVGLFFSDDSNPINHFIMFHWSTVRNFFGGLSKNLKKMLKILIQFWEKVKES